MYAYIILGFFCLKKLCENVSFCNMPRELMGYLFQAWGIIWRDKLLNIHLSCRNLTRSDNGRQRSSFLRRCSDRSAESLMVEVEKCLVWQYPTDSFTTLKLQNQSNDVFELHIIRRSPDPEALKLWKGRSGKYMLEDVRPTIVQLNGRQAANRFLSWNVICEFKGMAGWAVSSSSSSSSLSYISHQKYLFIYFERTEKDFFFFTRSKWEKPQKLRVQLFPTVTIYFVRYCFRKILPSLFLLRQSSCGVQQLENGEDDKCGEHFNVLLWYIWMVLQSKNIFQDGQSDWLAG